MPGGPRYQIAFRLALGSVKGEFCEDYFIQGRIGRVLECYLVVDSVADFYSERDHLFDLVGVDVEAELVRWDHRRIIPAKGDIQLDLLTGGRKGYLNVFLLHEARNVLQDNISDYAVFYLDFDLHQPSRRL